MDISKLTSTEIRKLFVSEYSAWQAMKRRCLSMIDKDWPRYGGRGIKICDRWLKFDYFFEDMGPRPAKYTLERINTEGNYEPGNCKWVTRQENNSNRRNSRNIRLLIWNGTAKTVADWSRELNLPVRVIFDRLQHNWTHERTLSTKHPAKPGPKRKADLPTHSVIRATEP